MLLSEQQLNHFETFGFLVFRQLLSPAEMERYSEEFDAGMAAWLEGEEFDGEQRHYATLMEEASPFIAGLAAIPASATSPSQLFGRRGIAIAVDGSYMVGDTAGIPTPLPSTTGGSSSASTDGSGAAPGPCASSPARTGSPCTE